MRTLRFKNEFEMAEKVIGLQMSNARFRVTGLMEITVEDYTPKVLPATFTKLLMAALAKRKVRLTGVTKKDDTYVLHTSIKDIPMKGAFSVNDVMAKL